MNILTLAAINLAVNSGVRYETDQAQYGQPEYWNPARMGGLGDCEDYALAKQLRLSAGCVSDADMGLCIVTTPTGDGHCVLCVRDGGDWYVMDNLTDEIRRPRDTGFRWYIMQVGSSWRYVWWVKAFGRTIRLLGLKAPSPPGWDDFIARTAAGR